MDPTPPQTARRMAGAARSAVLLALTLGMVVVDTRAAAVEEFGETQAQNPAPPDATLPPPPSIAVNPEAKPAESPVTILVDTIPASAKFVNSLLVVLSSMLFAAIAPQPCTA